MPMKERTMATERFQCVRDSLRLANPLKHSENPRYMIGVIAAVAEGYTLTKAPYITIMEPNYKWTLEKQAQGRVHRLTQQAKVTHGFRLYDDKSPIEARIIDRQEHRKTLDKTSGETVVQAQEDHAQAAASSAVAEQIDEI